MAIQNHLSLELVPVLLDVVVLDHNDHHIHLGEELVEVEDLVLDNLLLGEKGVEGLEGTGEVALPDEPLRRELLRLQWFGFFRHIYNKTIDKSKDCNE